MSREFFERFFQQGPRSLTASGSPQAKFRFSDFLKFRFLFFVFEISRREIFSSCFFLRQNFAEKIFSLKNFRRRFFSQRIFSLAIFATTRFVALPRRLRRLG